MTKFKPFFIKKRFLSRSECDYLINLSFKEEEVSEENIYNRKRNKYFDISTDNEIFLKVSKLISKVNNKYYGFDMEVSNKIELYKYETGDFFDFHMDLYGGDASYRKLTFLILLSDGEDFQGGDLKFFANTEASLPKEIGTIAVYPSFIMHCVTKVTHGIRLTLGGECLGNPFK